MNTKCKHNNCTGLERVTGWYMKYFCNDCGITIQFDEKTGIKTYGVKSK